MEASEFCRTTFFLSVPAVMFIAVRFDIETPRLGDDTSHIRSGLYLGICPRIFKPQILSAWQLARFLCTMRVLIMPTTPVSARWASAAVLCSLRVRFSCTGKPLFKSICDIAHQRYSGAGAHHVCAPCMCTCRFISGWTWDGCSLFRSRRRICLTCRTRWIGRTNKRLWLKPHTCGAPEVWCLIAHLTDDYCSNTQR